MKQQHGLSVVFIAVAAAFLSVVPADASTPWYGDSPSESARNAIAREKYIREVRRAVAPFAHVMFCAKTPADCERSGLNLSEMPLDAAGKKLLYAVNHKVNVQIRPRRDGGVDTWTLNPKTGDCEDFAITKRHMLLDHGWPSSVLRLATGYTASGEGHLVLVVRTTAGDLVLNNLTDEILPYREAGLSWQLIQSSRDPRIWYRMSR